MDFLQTAIKQQIAIESQHAAAILNPCKGVTSQDVRNFFSGAGFGVSCVTRTAAAKWQANVSGPGAYRAFRTAEQFSRSYPGHEVKVLIG